MIGIVLCGILFPIVLSETIEPLFILNWTDCRENDPINTLVSEYRETAGKAPLLLTFE